MTPNRWSSSSGRREPAELLKPVVDPAAWYPAEMASSECWIYRLSDTENDEIEAAVRSAESQDILTVGKKEFSLPRLAPVLAEVQHELMRGRGFALLRGVRLDRMTKTQRSIAFWGVGAHIGRAIPQNGKEIGRAHV